MLCILINLYMYIIMYNMIAGHNKAVNHRTRSIGRTSGVATGATAKKELSKIPV